MFAHARAYVEARVAILSDRLEAGAGGVRARRVEQGAAAAFRCLCRGDRSAAAASIANRMPRTALPVPSRRRVLRARPFSLDGHAREQDRRDPRRTGPVARGRGGRRCSPMCSRIAGTPSNKWSDLDHSERWSAFFLWRHGVRVDEACARCPRNRRRARRAAAFRHSRPIADRFLLAAASRHAHPAAYRGHQCPRDRSPAADRARRCGFRVGGETRPWVEGEAFAFDDTIEHEAWNESSELRAVLILDVWNPHIDEDERMLLRAYFEESIASGLSPNPDDASD